MARYSISGRSTIAPTSARPGVSVFAIASVDLHVREIQAFNTTTTAFCLAAVRLTNATGQGAGLTEGKFGGTNSPTASGTGFAGHTADPGLGDELLRGDLAAAIGAGIIWTFDNDGGLLISAGTANGVGLMTPSGSPGQIFDYTVIWDE